MFPVSYSIVAAAAELAMTEDFSIFSPFPPLSANQIKAARFNQELWARIEATAAYIAPAVFPA